MLNPIKIFMFGTVVVVIIW